jgi:Phage tail lysozyme
MGANIIFSELMQKNGGAPRDEESLRNFLHVDKKDWSQNYVATPASQRAMQDYFEAVQKNDPAALRFLGQLLTGHPDEVNSMLESSPTFKSLTGYQQDIVRSNVLQSTLGQSVEFGSSKATAGNAPGGSFQQRAELERARLQRDLGLTPAQSAGLAGALAGEGLSTGNGVGKAPGTGGFGLAQWTGSRRADFFKWAQSQGRDPSSYESQQDYLESELQSRYPKVLADLKNANNVDDATRASLPYLFGDGSTPDSAGLYNAHGGERMQMARGIYTGYTSNSPLPELNKGADAQVANTKAAEYVNNVSDTVTAGFTRMVHAGDEVVAMFQRLSSAGNSHAAQRMPGGFMSPDGLWVPLSTQSGGALK